ncbi:hypothetical protein JOF48_001234 [Arthrobacter stackebrandtii]|uniref:LytR/CpsA/Psr regulator C-terminal domain-containing protein n=1 Tax=Arthrobacter stackebrandtii TaxID=272161 RepID=A0ABS4YUF8_9MICC|nr:hypothetical protein [Arthrobacter stackebrandtii]PYH02199.1 hypothetical protein CVV67_01825 [Arthrobacter stackebrandtii]
MTERSGALAVTVFLGTAAVLAGAIAAVAGIGLNSAASKILPAPPPACPTAGIEAAPLAGLSVKIHNAAHVEGLAAGMATRLKAHGITVESVGNRDAPELAASGADVVITAPSGNLAPAMALQGLFPRSVFLLEDGEAGTSLYLTSEKPAMADAPVGGMGTLRCSVGTPAPTP